MSAEPTISTSLTGIGPEIRQIARALADGLSAVDTLPLIANCAASALQASTVVIALLEDECYLRFTAVAGERMRELQGLRTDADESIAGRVLRSRLPEIVSSFALGHTLSTTLDERTAPSIAAAPIQSNGTVIGVLLAMAAHQGLSFSTDQLDLLALFGDQVAAAISLDEAERYRADQARELSVIFKASRAVGGSLNLPEVLDTVLGAVCEAYDSNTAVIMLANDEKTHLFVAAERGLSESDSEVQLDAKCPVIAALLAEGTTRTLRTHEMPKFGRLVQGERTRAAMVAPIQSRGECHGVLLVTSSQPENFTAGDLKLLHAVASNAGSAIGNAWLYEDAVQKVNHAGALYDLSRRLNSTLNADGVCDLAAESVLGLLHADSTAVLHYDNRAGLLEVRSSRGMHAEGLERYSVRPGEGVPGWVYEWGTPQSVVDIRADPRNATGPLDTVGIESLLAAPIATGERSFGVLLAATANRRLFTVGEMELLYTVANQAAVTLANAEHFAQARAKSAELRRYFRRGARALGNVVQGDGVPQLFADLALALLRGAVCNVYRLVGDTLVLHASSTDRPGLVADRIVSVGEGLTGSVTRRGQHVAVSDVASDIRTAAHGWTARQRFTSYLGVPLRTGGHICGVVEVFTAEPHEDLREEARLLAQFARLARVGDRLIQPADQTS